MRFLNNILDIIFPRRCLSCRESGFDLCMVCLADFPPAERESAKWIFPFFDYRHPPIKKALWLLKYKDKKRLANVFAHIMRGRILEELSELSVMENFREPMLIPIPLAPKRLRERGYNQTELICRELIKIQHLAPPLALLSVTRREGGGEVFTLITNVLIKPKDTEHQARIKNRQVRLQNVVGSFVVKKPELIKGKNIILIDDITTTGATLTEARKILKSSGARKVIAFTIAH